MADFENLLSDDDVIWIYKNQIIHAKVVNKARTLILIEFEHNNQKLNALFIQKTLRLIRGGKKKLQREADALQTAIDFTRAYSVGPKKLREVFEREKAKGLDIDYGEIETRVIAYEKQFPKLKDLKGKPF